MGLYPQAVCDTLEKLMFIGEQPKQRLVGTAMTEMRKKLKTYSIVERRLQRFQEYVMADLNIKAKLAKDTIKADAERHIKVNAEKMQGLQRAGLSLYLPGPCLYHEQRG